LAKADRNESELKDYRNCECRSEQTVISHKKRWRPLKSYSQNQPMKKAVRGTVILIRSGKAGLPGDHWPEMKFTLLRLSFASNCLGVNVFRSFDAVTVYVTPPARLFKL
jgi:hypothetical protein